MVWGSWGPGQPRNWPGEVDRVHVTEHRQQRKAIPVKQCGGDKAKVSGVSGLTKRTTHSWQVIPGSYETFIESCALNMLHGLCYLILTTIMLEVLSLFPFYILRH